MNIAYCVEGQGYPVVLGVGWINPMELTWQHGPSWNSFAEYSRHFALVRFDRRGIGHSDRHISDFSVEARVRDLEAVVDTLQLDRFALYGASEAGPMAILYAARHPDRVSHLVLHGSYARGARLSNAKASEAVVSLVREQWSMGSAAITEAFLGPDASPQEREWFTRLQREGANRHDAAGIMEAIPSIDVTPILGDIKVPTLIVHGTNDTIRPIENAKELAALIPNARLVTYPGGHFLSETRADATVKREVIEFISGRTLPEESLSSASTALVVSTASSRRAGA